MHKELSILIPTYNDSCTEIVLQLVAQADKIEGLNYEIVIADDGSTDAEVMKENQQLSALEHCKLYRYEKNRGRAAIRNSLVEFANYPWLLFIDSGHMRLCADDYLMKYLMTNNEWRVVYGGYSLSEPSTEDKRSNLRYKYEAASKQNASSKLKKDTAHTDFHSSNFIVSKDVFRHVQFDERFVRYGYEDLLMGKDIRSQGIEIHYIDNPTLFCGYEDNPTFLRKTIESLHTLKEFESELGDSSRIIRTVKRLESMGLAPLVRKIYRYRKEHWIANLEGSNPSVRIFNLFKIGFYLDN